MGRVPAGEIEAAVIEQLRAVFRQPEIVAGTWKAAREQNGDITEAEAREALQQLDPLWEELFPAERGGSRMTHANPLPETVTLHVLRQCLKPCDRIRSPWVPERWRQPPPTSAS
ncbi:hypothetical protein [Chelativorans sp. YIM 93263]|uniref:hypothetical protein n=1 Tax=Chelativorans sp. YIM 93263 TaxID=2906648 RepID=UPI003082F281